jgi:hypothetical protein
MIAYVCNCGYVGFSNADAAHIREEECVVHCARCNTPEKHFHGWGEVKMSTEEKIQGFINWVDLEKPKENT